MTTGPAPSPAGTASLPHPPAGSSTSAAGDHWGVPVQLRERRMLRTGRWRYGRPRLASPSVFALLLVSSVTAGTLWLAREGRPLHRRSSHAYRAGMSQSEADPAVAGVTLTNLDQPLFDGAGATKRDLVDYLDQIADRLIPQLRDRPLSVIRVLSRAGAVHAEEPAEVHAGVGGQRDRLGGDRQAGRPVRAGRGPPDAGVVRQPAGGRVPPDAGAAGSLGPADHLVLDLDPPPTDDGTAGSGSRSAPPG